TCTVTSSSLLASAWHVGMDNTFRIRKIGSSAALAWVRVVAEKSAVRRSACLLDIEGGDCAASDLCSTDFDFDPFDQTVTIADVITGTFPAIETPFTHSQLPDFIDIEALPDGPFTLCVRDGSNRDSTLYGASRNGELFTIDPATGHGTLVGLLPFATTEIEYANLLGRAFAQEL